MRKLILSILLLLPLIVNAQTTATIDVTWTPPAVDVNHTAPTSYILQWRVVGAAGWTTATPNIPTTTFSLTIPVTTTVEARVAAIDNQGRQGIWSEVSDPYTWRQPGACGKPVFN